MEELEEGSVLEGDFGWFPLGMEDGDGPMEELYSLVLMIRRVRVH